MGHGSDKIRRLACDYAEHVVCICEEALHGDPRFRHALFETRRFLGGEATIEDVAQADADLFKGHYKLRRHPKLTIRIASEASWVINLAILACCQRQLEALGVMARTRFQPRVDGVATKASYAVAR